MDEVVDHHLREEVDLMEVDKVADWWKRLDDLVTMHLARTRTQSEELRNEAPNLFQKINHLVTKVPGSY